MAAILGISAFYHDSAAALVVDGQIVAAAQEERFSRKNHDVGFPSRAVAYCLAGGGLSASDLDWVGFFDKLTYYTDFRVNSGEYKVMGLAPYGEPSRVAGAEGPRARGDGPAPVPSVVSLRSTTATQTDRLCRCQCLCPEGVSLVPETHMDMSYFNYCQGLTMTSRKFHRLFGGPPRKPFSGVPGTAYMSLVVLPGSFEE
jgi:hypothetical protein